MLGLASMAVKYVCMLLAAAWCVDISVAQTAGAPAPTATPTLYQRPNNSDCVTSTSSTTNYFPLEFQISSSSSSTPQQDQINVSNASQRQVCAYRPPAWNLGGCCAQVTVAQDFTVQYMDSYKVKTAAQHLQALASLCSELQVK